MVFGSTVHLLSLLCCAMRFHLIIVLASTASTAALTRTQMEDIAGVRLPGPPEVSTDDVANLLLGDPTESKDTPPHTPESQSPTSVAGAIRELQRIAQTAVRNSLSMTTHKVSRFDVFTRIIALQNKIEVDDWRARNAPLGRPTARDVDVPVAKRDVDHVQCGLAYNAEADAVVVAKTDEHQARASLIPTLGVTVSHRDLGLPPRPRWSPCRKWRRTTTPSSPSASARPSATRFRPTCAVSGGRTRTRRASSRSIYLARGPSIACWFRGAPIV